MIKLIASDIDGTLIPDSTPDLYPEIEEEIRSLVRRGVLFCAASGRPVSYTHLAGETDGRRTDGRPGIEKCGRTDRKSGRRAHRAQSALFLSVVARSIKRPVAIQQGI